MTPRTMHGLRSATATHDRALGMRAMLAEIADQADAEAVRCSHVLAALDLGRARECRELARRSAVLAHAITDWRNPATPQERRLSDALEFQAIVQESSRLGLGAERPSPVPERASD